MIETHDVREVKKRHEREVKKRHERKVKKRHEREELHERGVT